MNNKGNRIRQRLLLWGMGFFVLACGVTTANIVILPFSREYFGYMTPLMLLSFALSAGGYLFAGRKINAAQDAAVSRAARIAVPVYLLFLFVIHLMMAYFMEYKPSGDNFMIYNASQLRAKDGNFDAYPDFYLYLSRYSNQWGFVLLLSGLYKLLFALGLTDMFFPTAFVQALLYVGGMAAYFAIARRLRGARGVLAALVIAVTCFPLYLAAAVLYTDTFSLPFVMIALLFALRAMDAKTTKQTLLESLVSAAAAAVGGQIKMTVAIVLIAAAIIFALRLRPLRVLYACAVLALTMGMSLFAVNKAMVGPVLDPAMVAQHNTPTIHWIMMSIPTGRNPYGNDIEDYRQTWTMMEQGASREEVMNSIYTRLIDKIYYMRLPSRLIPGLLKKNIAAFGDGTFGMTEILDDSPKRENIVSSFVLQERPYYPLYLSVCTGIYCAHLTFALLACLRDMRRKDLRAAMLYVAMFGLIVFMILWEARSRYIFNFVPVLLLLSMGFIARGAQEGENNA